MVVYYENRFYGIVFYGHMAAYELVEANKVQPSYTSGEQSEQLVDARVSRFVKHHCQM